MSIIDTHMHLWDPNALSYPWLAEVPTLNRPYLLDDYRAACGGHDVEQMVFVQCETPQYLEEARWVAQLAEDEPRIAGIVARAPLEEDAAGVALEQLAQLPLVRGIRRMIQSEPDPAFCLQPNFIRGVKLLSNFDFTFDICISHSQLAGVIDMVRLCPEVTFILDHIAKPDIKNQVFDPWKAQIRELASLPNVWCKISGLVVEADHKAWTADDLKPYIDHVVACFGIDRIMFGGDWPVVVLASPLHRWIDTLKAHVADWSPADREKLFRENARRFYRLG